MDMRTILLLMITLLVYTGCNKNNEESAYVVADNPVTKLSKKTTPVDTADLKKLKKVYRFDNYEFNDYLGGLNPSYAIARVVYYTSNPLFYNLADSFLFFDELGVRGYRLLIKKKNDFILIRNIADLKAYYCPIETKEEALSFVCAQSFAVPMYKFDIKKNFIIHKKKINKTYVELLNNRLYIS